MFCNTQEMSEIYFSSQIDRPLITTAVALKLFCFFTLLKRPELCNPLSSYRDPDSNFVTRGPTGKYVVKKEFNNDLLDYVDNKVG